MALGLCLAGRFPWLPNWRASSPCVATSTGTWSAKKTMSTSGIPHQATIKFARRHLPIVKVSVFKETKFVDENGETRGQRYDLPAAGAVGCRSFDDRWAPTTSRRSTTCSWRSRRPPATPRPPPTPSVALSAKWTQKKQQNTLQFVAKRRSLKGHIHPQKKLFRKHFLLNFKWSKKLWA